ncbi:hypothetical protein C8J56DRAFT_989225 [Mycena floridula]|nr:hypothetical protein C8J56DRAFT_989225 [Mycena floridula]
MLTYDDLHCWPFTSVYLPITPLRYSELRPFWEAISTFLGFKWEFMDVGSRGASRTASAATATETNRVTTLLSLCLSFWEDVRDPQDHYKDFRYSLVIQDLISFVSPLAEGSARAQQAFSAAILIITSALEQASPDLEGRTFLWAMAAYMVSGLVKHLLKVTDETAVTAAQRVLCSSVWSEYFPDDIPVSWHGNPAFSRIIYANQIVRSLGPERSPWPSIPEKVTLAGMHSTMQIELTHPLKSWLTEIPPDDCQHIPSLFRLLGTLDEPKAVIEVQRALREFLTKPRQAESNLDAAREALEQLEKTARKPEFVFKALSIPDYP